MRALVDLQPTSALVERRVRAYLHSSELDDFSYPWPDTQSGCQSVRVCKIILRLAALRKTVSGRASLRNIILHRVGTSEDVFMLSRDA